jgi:outer membrane protein OmpA-like peptidoglycan-associated protein
VGGALHSSSHQTIRAISDGAEQMKKQIVASLFAVLPLAAEAQSNVPADAELFKPATGQGYFGVTGADILANFRFTAGAFLNYARRPFAVFSAPDNALVLSPVANNVAFDVVAAIGLKNLVEIGVGLPVALFQNGDDLADIGGVGTVQSGQLGDPRIVAKLKLIGNPEDPADAPFALSLFGEARLPVLEQSGANFFGSGTFSALGGLAFRTGASKLSLGGNLGFLFRPEKSQIENITIGNDIKYGLGLGYKVNDAITATGELDGALSIESQTNAEGEAGGLHAPAELRAGAKIAIGKTKSLLVPVGLGVGLNNGVGAPDFRLFAGVTYVAQDLDPDKDGILIPLDSCPKDAEDMDGFEDSNGCPEVDNDQDGVLDAAPDACLNEAEDKDTFKDEDGCPDPDNDADGVNDTGDRCPNEAEDKDSFKDEDGCPEVDNDEDGIADKEDECPLDSGAAEFKGCPDTDADKLINKNDKCPNDPEDFDKFQDEDGCPELDNDNDGISDASDLCPNDPENKNGEKDEDGCPDEVKAVVSGGSIVILDKIFFDLGKATIKVVSNPVLDSVAKVLVDNPQIKKIRIEGNTDDLGDDKKNQLLSENRAKAVQDYLVKKGVDAARLEVKGNGEAVPLAPVTGLNPLTQKKELEAAREKNRRVEFVIVEQ